MLLRSREWPIFLANLVYIPIFTVIALRRLNFEFLLYVGVIMVLGVWIVVKQRSVHFEPHVLWGLTVWGLLHMAGGNIEFDGVKLYEQELLRLIPRFHVLRYDQLVHTLGFGVATLVCAHLLRPCLKADASRRSMPFVLVVLMGAGVGALNEILEFAVVVVMPETGVGGYENTMLDLVFNLLGGTLAALWLRWRGGLVAGP